MSAPKADGGNVQPWVPLHRGSTRDNLPQFKFKTWCSAAAEPVDSFDPEARSVVIGALSFGVTVILLCLGAIELLK